VVVLTSSNGHFSLIPEGGLFTPIKNLFNKQVQGKAKLKIHFFFFNLCGKVYFSTDIPMIERRTFDEESRGTRGIFGQIYTLFSTSVDLASKIQKAREKSYSSDRNDVVIPTSNVRFEAENNVESSRSTKTVGTTTTPTPVRSDLIVDKSSFVNGSTINMTSLEEKGIFDDIANGINSFFDSGGPAIDTGENLGIVPNHCWLDPQFSLMMMMLKKTFFFAQVSR